MTVGNPGLSEIAALVMDVESAEFDLNDPRLDEVVALIGACSVEPDLKARFREAAEHSDVLAVLGINSDAPDRRKGIDDVAAVLAAYSYARENDAWRQKHVRETLTAVLKNATDIAAKLGLSHPADPPRLRARLMIEEAALRSALKEALPRERPLNRFQFTPKVKVLSAVKSGGVVRQGIEGARRASRSSSKATSLSATVDLARRYGLSPEHETLAAEGAEDIMNRLWGGIGLLIQTLNAVLKTFPAPEAKFRDPADQKAALLATAGRMAGLHIMPSGMVLAWGALELFVAWRPDKKPSTTGAQKVRKAGVGNLSNLLVELYNAVDGNEADDKREVRSKQGLILAAGEGEKQKERNNRSQQRLVVATWKAGRHAVLFDGRTGLTREQRIVRLCNKELDEYYGSEEGVLPHGIVPGRRNRASSPDMLQKRIYEMRSTIRQGSPQARRPRTGRTRTDQKGDR